MATKWGWLLILKKFVFPFFVLNNTGNEKTLQCLPSDPALLARKTRVLTSNPTLANTLSYRYNPPDVVLVVPDIVLDTGLEKQTEPSFRPCVWETTPDKKGIRFNQSTR